MRLVARLVDVVIDGKGKDISFVRFMVLHHNTLYMRERKRVMYDEQYPKFGHNHDYHLLPLYL